MGGLFVSTYLKLTREVLLLCRHSAPHSPSDSIEVSEALWLLWVIGLSCRPRPLLGPRPLINKPKRRFFGTPILPWGASQYLRLCISAIRISAQ
jgi:hypothetical protein